MVADVITESPDTKTLVLFTGNDRLDYQPGHFLSIRPQQFGALDRFIKHFEDLKGKKEPPRAYSLSSAPHERYLAAYELIEFELAPLVDALQLDDIVAALATPIANDLTEQLAAFLDAMNVALPAHRRMNHLSLTCPLAPGERASRTVTVQRPFYVERIFASAIPPDRGPDLWIEGLIVGVQGMITSAVPVLALSTLGMQLGDNVAHPGMAINVGFSNRGERPAMVAVGIVGREAR